MTDDHELEGHIDDRTQVEVELQRAHEERSRLLCEVEHLRLELELARQRVSRLQEELRQLSLSRVT